MASPRIRVLIAEDTPADAELQLRELKRAGLKTESKIVAAEAAFVSALRDFRPDVILSDFSMPGFDGMAALELARKLVPDTPFMFVSGTLGENYAIRALKSGATDYVLKTNLARLPAAVERALADSKKHRDLRRAEGALARAQVIAKLAHVVTGPEGAFESWSDTLPQLIGVDPAQMPRRARDWLEVVHPEDRSLFRDAAIRAASEGKRLEIEYRLRARGEWIHLRQTMEPLNGQADADGGVRWFNTVQDITVTKRSEERIKRLTRVHAVLSGINSAIVRIRDRQTLFRESCRIAVEAGQLRLAWVGVVDAQQEMVVPAAFNGPEQGLLGVIRLSTREDSRQFGMAGRAIRDRLPAISNDVLAEHGSRVRGESAERGFRSLAMIPLIVDGAAFGVLGLHAAEPGFFDQEETKLLLEVAGNIAFALEHMAKEEKVRRLTRVEGVLSGINALIVRVGDRDELFREACRIAVLKGEFPLAWVAISDPREQQLKAVAWAGDEHGFVQLTRPTADAKGQGKAGLSAQAIEKRAPAVCNDIEADGSAMRFAEEALERGYRSAVALPLTVDGAAIGALVLYAAEVGFFDDEEIKLLKELAGDISFALEHIEKAEKLDYLAYYDALTGLANRALFEQRLEQKVIAAHRAQRRQAVFMLDIERFKTINDAYGRQAGDALLKQVADRLVTTGGDASRFARIGADHFAIMTADTESEEQVARYTEQWLDAVFGPPYHVAGQEITIAARVGISMFPSDGTDADTLLRNAEAALKKVKRTGERYLFYAQEMTERVAENLTLESKLRRALENEEFVLHYQPKVDLETRSIVGVEALIRWQSPELGLVPPLRFIPLLEETGLIMQVGSWALKQAALDHRSWVERGLKPPRVAVNISPIQLRQRDFVALVETAIIEGVAPTGIDLEITESLIMEDIEGTIQKLKAIRELGVNIAIDDFGTGYSSLGYLAKLPVQSLKIDRSFIVAMEEDSNDMTLVSTIISLAHSLKLKVVAEGVETAEQANYLRLLRCDEMQGYLFSKPLPREDLVALLEKRAHGGR
jgi:diguanylate cyclase (GGDEF)-like protein/PAS domain S-box-containing protein